MTESTLYEHKVLNRLLFLAKVIIATLSFIKEIEMQGVVKFSAVVKGVLLYLEEPFQEVKIKKG